MKRDTYIKKILLLFLLSIILLQACHKADNVAQVVEVIDGDTILIDSGYLVRYIGIDAPEKDDFAYYNATVMNEKLVLGKKVILERDVSDKDRYGRLLRYVFIDNTFVNAELVKSGFAFAQAYPPDIKYQVFLEALENEARQKRNGVWHEYE